MTHAAKPAGLLSALSLFAVTIAGTLATACAADAPAPSDVVRDEGTTLGAPAEAPASSADDAPAPPRPTPAPAKNAWVPLPYRGVNLAGAEFGDDLPGVEGSDYGFPTNAEIDYFVARGMNTFRIPFKWERLQPSLYGTFTATYFAKLDAVVVYATKKGAHVVLEPHNFARYRGSLIGSQAVPNAAFADLWKRLATPYAKNARVFFNLVNEPHDMPTEQWVAGANAAIAAIRAAGAKNLIHVPGNAWTGAHAWEKTHYGTSNAVAMLGIVDPADNHVFEVHQYLDTNSGGASDQCVSATIGSERLASFVAWLRKHGKKGFVGEFAGGKNALCRSAVADMVTYMESQSDVLAGWLWWAGGPKWGNYPFLLDPSPTGDSPHMALLAPHLAPITPVRRVATETTNDYCASVDLYAWSGLASASWQSARIELFDATATKTTGGTLSGTTGKVDLLPGPGQGTIAPLGVASFSLCATKGSSGAKLSVLGVDE